MKITLIITAIGAAAGFAYASVLGCDTVCSMTSSSLNTTVYGAFAGLLIAVSYTHLTLPTIYSV